MIAYEKSGLSGILRGVKLLYYQLLMSTDRCFNILRSESSGAPDFWDPTRHPRCDHRKRDDESPGSYWDHREKHCWRDALSSVWHDDHPSVWWRSWDHVKTLTHSGQENFYSSLPETLSVPPWSWQPDHHPDTLLVYSTQFLYPSIWKTDIVERGQ